MTDHTTEPWHIDAFNESFDIHGPEPNPPSDTEDCALVAEHLREANARRIVACVNACKDIPTEILEDASTKVSMVARATSAGWDAFLASKERELDQAKKEAAENMKGNLMWFNEAKKAHGEAARIKEATVREIFETSYIDGIELEYWLSTNKGVST